MTVAFPRGLEPEAVVDALPAKRLPNSFEGLLIVAAELFLTTPDEILGKDRTQNVVLARQVVAWVARERWGLSFPALGRLLGKRDHTTIMSSVRKIAREVERGTRVGRIAQELLAAGEPRLRVAVEGGVSM